ncbi:MAG: hypothetical protein BWY09_00132 [Candidatus Hydrogenedentes bacterium ADurb.Bin179]|nr:MAG: hypothetical protein BWY09_00132 [Candidatus Hydrogenedentes bacterium ADurb.Bin179]
MRYASIINCCTYRTTGLSSSISTAPVAEETASWASFLSKPMLSILRSSADREPKDARELLEPALPDMLLRELTLLALLAEESIDSTVSR